MTTKPRLRDLGITIGVMPPGRWNAITDVPGVRVGHTTVVQGEGMMQRGAGPVRTGVTAIHPHEGEAFRELSPAAIVVMNGAGEITGRSQIDEYGLLETPILITNTLSVGEVHRGCVDWLADREPELGVRYFVVPVVAETYDGFLNDIVGQHVTREHVFAALDSATSGPVTEGCVGGGTGMSLFGFKGGVGTASRMVTFDGREYHIGVQVQGNFGSRADLLIDGVRVGEEITDLLMERGELHAKEGSIIVVIGTDLPLSDRQLRRLCTRGMLGLARVGAIGGQSSGDLLLAFSNAPENRVQRGNVEPFRSARAFNDSVIDSVFRATVEATSEAVLNAMIAAETTIGRDGNTLHAIPHDRLREVMRKYGRLAGE